MFEIFNLKNKKNNKTRHQYFYEFSPKNQIQLAFFRKKFKKNHFHQNNKKLPKTDLIRCLSGLLMPKRDPDTLLYTQKVINNVGKCGKLW